MWIYCKLVAFVCQVESDTKSDQIISVAGLEWFITDLGPIVSLTDPDLISYLHRITKLGSFKKLHGVVVPDPHGPTLI
jgi:hypothetical protein